MGIRMRKATRVKSHLVALVEEIVAGHRICSRVR